MLVGDHRVLHVPDHTSDASLAGHTLCLGRIVKDDAVWYDAGEDACERISVCALYQTPVLRAIHGMSCLHHEA